MEKALEHLRMAEEELAAAITIENEARRHTQDCRNRLDAAQSTVDAEARLLREAAPRGSKWGQ